VKPFGDGLIDMLSLLLQLMSQLTSVGVAQLQFALILLFLFPCALRFRT